ncbi:sugar phosphate isomerase/epimerase family protein [Parapedobacter sp. DT-150]|uniref:sugar phosphate isomerase/epimerase family protein n=1 Tax=Parapedobacter sp. DT-150 TaxID=3396162 RepID=UPI003F19B5EB
MKHKITIVYLICLLFLSHSIAFAGLPKKPKRLKLGTSIGINDITPEKMNYAKSVGIDYIETAIDAVDVKQLTFTSSKEEIVQLLQQAKKAADDAGINVWSIHMPWSDKLDLSRTDEAERRKVVEFHKQVLEYVKILEPEIILFHPSYLLHVNEREARAQQFIKSATELNNSVKSIGATMVIENMLGVNDYTASVLMGSVEEAVKIMNRLPKDIYLAVDLNHIKDPEKLLRALGKRIKTLHVADGKLHEEHYFPCSGQGQNNWVEIFAALDEINYSGPFMYESKYPDLKDLQICYDIMYSNYVNTLSGKK